MDESSIRNNDNRYTANGNGRIHWKTLIKIYGTKGSGMITQTWLPPWDIFLQMRICQMKY